METLDLNDTNASIRSLIFAHTKKGVTDKEKSLYPLFIVQKIMMMQVMDNLKDTSVYQQEVKQLGNKFRKALDKGIIDDRYFQIYDADREALANMERGVELLVNALCNATHDVWGIIAIAADLAIKDKEYVLDRLNIVYGESERVAEMREKEDIMRVLRKMPMQGVKYIKPHLDAAARLYPPVLEHPAEMD